MLSLPLLRTFNRNFSWNVSGNILYELMRVGHTLLLFCYMPTNGYGHVGVIFSFLYLFAKVADGAAAYTITPFFAMFKNASKKQRFQFAFYYLMLSLPTLGVGILLFSYFLRLTLFQCPEYPILAVSLPILLFSEVVRIIARHFLYAAFYYPQAIIIELILFFIYLAVVWIGYAFYGLPLSLQLVFLPFLGMSILAAVLLLWKSFCIGRSLKSQEDKASLSLFPPRRSLLNSLIKSRSINYILILGREAFTANVITPVLAITFDFSHAALFYVIGMISHATYNLVKASIANTAGALFATLKTADRAVKREAFSLVVDRFILLALWAAIILLFVFKFISCYIQGMFVVGLVYAALIASELLFLVYEHFYLVEDRLVFFVTCRFLEFSSLYALVMLFKYFLATHQIDASIIRHQLSSSPLFGVFFIVLLVIRLAVFSFLASHSYRQWQLTWQPDRHIKLLLVALILFFSLIIFL